MELEGIAQALLIDVVDVALLNFSSGGPRTNRQHHPCVGEAGVIQCLHGCYRPVRGHEGHLEFINPARL